MSGIILGALMAASVGLSLDQHYSLRDWMRDGSILGIGTGLSAWAFSAFSFRIPRPHRSPPFRRWYEFVRLNTIAPRSFWQAALMLGGWMGLSYGLDYVLRYGL